MPSISIPLSLSPSPARVLSPLLVQLKRSALIWNRTNMIDCRLAWCVSLQLMRDDAMQHQHSAMGLDSIKNNSGKLPEMRSIHSIFHRFGRGNVACVLNARRPTDSMAIELNAWCVQCVEHHLHRMTACNETKYIYIFIHVFEAIKFYLDEFWIYLLIVNECAVEKYK